MAEFHAPQFVANGSFGGIAPNGTLTATALYGTVKIIDLTTGAEQTFEPTSADVEYSLGVGHTISNNGIVVGSTSPSGNAAYYKDGEWHMLSVESDSHVNLAQAITPDGSRICGLMGKAPISIDGDNTMGVPAYWDANADGTFGEYHLLPYPEKDFSGRAPQYVTATDISEDGKTIAGQLVDCSGFFRLPIIYTQDEAGEWTYSYLAYDQILPEDLSLPENPGEAPARPDPVDYMTEEEKAEYEAAYQAWIESGYQLEYPEPTSYLSEEALAKYNEDMAAYEEVFAVWQEKSDAYYTRFYEIVEQSVEFEFNQAYLTPDGSKFFCNALIPGESDPGSWMPAPATSEPWQISTADSKITKYQFEGIGSIGIHSVADNDTYFASNGVGASPMTGYIIKNGECTNLYDFICSQSTEMAAWAEENLIHEVEVYNWETDEFSYEERKYTGLAYATADLKHMVMWHQPEWVTEDMALGYIFDFTETSGIKGVGAEAEYVLDLDADGNVVADNVSDVKLYDLSGRRVATANASGVYILTATAADGTVITKKIVK